MSADNSITLFQALERSHDRWTPETSNVDAEQAFLDRTLLASEITGLQKELAATLDALREAEREVEALQGHSGT